MKGYEKYQQWERQIRQVSLPHWSELPKFDLYMDQVLAFLNGTLGALGLETVTAPMVNNYVKHKIIIAPVKKKYQTMHLVDLIMISLLKPMFSMETIRSGMDQVTAGDFPKQAYDNFIDALNDSLAHLGEDRKEPQSSNLNQKLMQVAVDAVVDSIQAKQLLSLIERPLRKIDKAKK
ncbi:DUF1836 domain-containing protein [Secundilactobacillus malefermentans]|uniref:DUF1836 domain-containing protein n=1 Tax=Secundilactobacillus malefermentans TaxID=176292 RepID=UPI0011C7C085|nr:DUF1836 domain-containing protein [Secundilactobacillus malefermentans]QEA31606.1 DUF1836 domain-containing protein [Secundilactobacillus malefermentans]